MKNFKKWQKAKQKLEKAKAIESELRNKLGDGAITGEETRTTLLEGDFKVAIAKKTGYTVPSTSIKRLKRKLGIEVFENTFYTNHSIREGAYKKLPEKQLKIVNKLIRIYSAPYQITVTER